jgi:hypothetical protein
MRFLLSYILIQTIKLTNDRILNDVDFYEFINFFHPNIGQEFIYFPYKIAIKHALILLLKRTVPAKMAKYSVLEFHLRPETPLKCIC